METLTQAGEVAPRAAAADSHGCPPLRCTCASQSLLRGLGPTFPPHRRLLQGTLEPFEKLVPEFVAASAKDAKKARQSWRFSAPEPPFLQNRWSLLSSVPTGRLLSGRSIPWGLRWIPLCHSSALSSIFISTIHMRVSSAHLQGRTLRLPISRCVHPAMGLRRLCSQRLRRRPRGTKPRTRTLTQPSTTSRRCRRSSRRRGHADTLGRRRDCLRGSPGRRR